MPLGVSRLSLAISTSAKRIITQIADFAIFQFLQTQSNDLILTQDDEFIRIRQQFFIATQSGDVIISQDDEVLKGNT
tara:strand:+ start:166 stop:396 length:231 start_codon:yes stop_codon:yes gene_type:complete